MSPPSRGHNLFLSLTPYNVFHACGIALSSPHSENHLLLCADSADAHVLVEVLRSWRESPFASIRVFPGLRTSQPPVERVLTASWNARRIGRIVRSGEYSSLYLFNERRPESQSAMYWIKRTRPDSQVIVIEDGMNSYRLRPFQSNQTKVFRWGRKLFYGSWWEDVQACGASSWADKVLLVFPVLVHDRIDPERTIPAERESLTSAAMQSLAVDYIHAMCGHTATLRELDGLLLVAHSRTALREPDYGRLVRGFVKSSLSSGIRLGVKYHPREDLEDPFELENMPHVCAVSRGIGSEFLLVHPHLEFQYVIGDMTSALLTSRWLCPKTTALSLAPVLTKVDTYMFPKMQRVGIRLVHSLRDVRRAFAA